MSTLVVTNIKHESSTSNTIVLSSDGSAAITASSINSGPLAGFRNATINGNFDIWQRGTSFSSPADGAYTADRWLIQYNGSGATRTLSRQAFTLGQTDVPGEPTYFLRHAQSVAGSGGTYNTITQRIEGVRTFAGRQVTLSFWAKAAASITLSELSFTQWFGTGGSPSSFTQTAMGSNVSIGTSWAKYSFTTTAPSVSGKTLGSNNDDFIAIDFRLPINATFTFDIAQVQLEAGPVATPFEPRPIGTELALCQRYFYAVNQARSWAWYGDTSTRGTPIWQNFPNTMRAAPSTTSAFSSGVNTSGAGTIVTTPSTFYAFIGTNAAGGASVTLNIGTFSAEL